MDVRVFECMCMHVFVCVNVFVCVSINAASVYDTSKQKLVLIDTVDTVMLLCKSERKKRKERCKKRKSLNEGM